MRTSKWRGHDIYFENEEWLFCDTHTACIRSTRPCGNCGQDATTEGHDPCLGTLPGVANACCGHGEERIAYVHFKNGKWYGGKEAVLILRKLQMNEKETS